MVAKHSVKVGGKWYRAGEEISPVKTNKEVEENIEYTKTEINRMSTAELKELAGKQGIDGAEDMTGAELKKSLIEHYGL